MKKIITAMATLVVLAGHAQEKGLQVAAGSSYEFTVYPGGVVFPMIISIDSLERDYVRLAWVNSSGVGGKYIITKSSLDSATTAFWGPPQYNEEIILEPHMSLLFFSRRQWTQLSGSGRVEFDGRMYAWREAVGDKALTIANKKVDALYLEGEGSSARIWLLNNPTFPMILKIENNPLGVDLEITNF